MTESKPPLYPPHVIHILLLINVPLTLMVLTPYIWVYVFILFLIVVVASGLFLVFAKNDNAQTQKTAKQVIYSSSIYFVLLCALIGIRGDGPVSFVGIILLSPIIIPIIILLGITLSRLITPKNG